MAVHPSVLPTTPEGNVWAAISDLRREVRKLRGGGANEPQHGYAENLTGVTGISTQTTLCSVTVNIPTADHRVLLVPTATFQQSNAASTWVLGYLNDVDLPGPVGIVQQVNTATGDKMYPFTNNLVIGALTVFGASMVLDPYSWDTGTPAPTPGDHTWSLVAYRTAGTATLTATDVRLWVAVL